MLLLAQPGSLSTAYAPRACPPSEPPPPPAPPQPMHPPNLTTLPPRLKLACATAPDVVNTRIWLASSMVHSITTEAKPAGQSNGLGSPLNALPAALPTDHRPLPPRRTGFEKQALPPACRCPPLCSCRPLRPVAHTGMLTGVALAKAVGLKSAAQHVMALVIDALGAALAGRVGDDLAIHQGKSCRGRAGGWVGGG